MTVHRGKGARRRPALLPRVITDGLPRHIERVARRHAAELRAGFGEVDLPEALTRKRPGAAKRPEWPYVFPASRRCTDPRSGRPMLHSLRDHKDIRTTMIYTHVLDRGPLGVISPLDR